MREPESDQARGAGAAGGAPRAVASGALHLVPGRRGLPHDGVRARRRGAAELRLGAPGGAARSSGRGASFAERPCHNDLLNANFIDDGSRIRIVDWEYAGMGDVFFDLANFSINHGLDRRAPAALLEAYFGEVEPATSARSS